MPIVITSKGTFAQTFRFLRRIRDKKFIEQAKKYGQMGVDALREATPKDTGLTSESWSYEIHSTGSSFTISWTNSNQNHGVYIAVLIQYGHGLKNGGYVQGRDYINPAMQPLFDQIANEMWVEVISD